MNNPTTEWGNAAQDLRWYFARTDSGPLKSNFAAMAYRIAMGRSRRDGPVGSDHDDFLVAAERAGGVARVLRALDATTIDVLWRAFGAEVPYGLAVIGELSALVPITHAAASAHRRAESPRPIVEWLATFVERPDGPRRTGLLERIKREARSLRSQAIAAYLTQRRKVGRHE